MYHFLTRTRRRVYDDTYYVFFPKILDQGLKIRQIAYEKKMTWKKGQEFRPSGQRPWRQKNSKHGKNVVLASCTYGFFKRCLVYSTTSSVLSVTGVLAPLFTYSYRLLSFAENHFG